jgi:hypothetical protein
LLLLLQYALPLRAVPHLHKHPPKLEFLGLLRVQGIAIKKGNDHFRQVANLVDAVLPGLLGMRLRIGRYCVFLTAPKVLVDIVDDAGIIVPEHHPDLWFRPDRSMPSVLE